MSSHPIPGNEPTCRKVIDGLVRLGAEVVHSGISDVHATGHAKQEELKTLPVDRQPEFFTPVHGEYRHLVGARPAGRRRWVPGRRTCVVCEDGDQLVLDDDGLRSVGSRCRPATCTSTASSATSATGVLRDRRVLAEEGVVVVVVTVDMRSGAIITGPEIITRGWVYAPEAEDLLEQCAEAVRDRRSRRRSPTARVDIETLQRKVRRAAGKFVNEQTSRRPMIVPVVMEA